MGIQYLIVSQCQAQLSTNRMPLMATMKHAGIFTFIVGMLWHDSQWHQTIVLVGQQQQHGTDSIRGHGQIEYLLVAVHT